MIQRYIKIDGVDEPLECESLGSFELYRGYSDDGITYFLADETGKLYGFVLSLTRNDETKWCDKDGNTMEGER